ncbi:hypothetical protein Tco_0432143 [Tanacetum coccineum]
MDTHASGGERSAVTRHSVRYMRDLYMTQEAISVLTAYYSHRECIVRTHTPLILHIVATLTGSLYRLRSSLHSEQRPLRRRVALESTVTHDSAYHNNGRNSSVMSELYASSRGSVSSLDNYILRDACVYRSERTIIGALSDTHSRIKIQESKDRHISHNCIQEERGEMSTWRWERLCGGSGVYSDLVVDNYVERQTGYSEVNCDRGQECRGVHCDDGG